MSRGELDAELFANEDATTEQRAGVPVILPSRLLRLALKTLRRSTFKEETRPFKEKKSQDEGTFLLMQFTCAFL